MGGDGLTQKQKEVATLLCQGMKNTQVARTCGVSRGTINNWKKLPEFKEYYQFLVGQSDEAIKTAQSAQAAEEVKKKGDKLNLNQKQRDAAAYLCQGLMVKEVAQLVGVSRVSITNWRNLPEFQEYLKILTTQYEIDRRKAASKITMKEAFDRHASLNEWRNSRIEANQKILECGFLIVDKMIRRIKDLPDEAFSAGNIAPLLKIGSEMVETGLTEWGEAIDLKDAKPTRTSEIEAIQKLVDADILPQGVRSEMIEALNEFQTKAINAIASATVKTQEPEQ